MIGIISYHRGKLIASDRRTPESAYLSFDHPPAPHITPPAGQETKLPWNRRVVEKE
jgi:hypothetical protein